MADRNVPRTSPVSTDSFRSLKIAMAMRDAIVDIVKSEIDRLRPRYQMAIVNSIDRVNRKCMVTLAGDTASVKVSMGSIQPLDVGQIVRIAGLTGDRYIDDVLGDAYNAGVSDGPDGYVDHGNQADSVTFDATIETHALTMTGDTTVTLSGGVNGKTIQIYSTGNYLLTVEGLQIPTGRALGTFIRGAWVIYIISGSGDVTAPTAGVLTVTFPGSDSSLSVAGAADYGAGLHAQPYAYSKDAGATWTSWQSGSTYTGFTALTPLTSYTFQHKVRDAVGNITLGAQVTQTTPATSSWTTLFSDSFTGSSGNLVGRTVESGAGTWALINTNQIQVDGSGSAKWDTHAASADAYVQNAATQTRMRSTVVYDISTHTTGGSTATVGVGFTTNSGATNQVYANIACSTSGNAATVTLLDNAAGTWTIAAHSGQALTSQPATGTMVVDIDIANLTGSVSINGTVIGDITGTSGATLCYGAQLHLQNSTAKAGSILVERFGT